jgi:hypothetical protein
MKQDRLKAFMASVERDFLILSNFIFKNLTLFHGFCDIALDWALSSRLDDTFIKNCSIFVLCTFRHKFYRYRICRCICIHIIFSFCSNTLKTFQQICFSISKSSANLFGAVELSVQKKLSLPLTQIDDASFLTFLKLDIELSGSLLRHFSNSVSSSCSHV